MPLLHQLSGYIEQLKTNRRMSNSLYAWLLGFLPFAFGSAASVWFYYGALVYLYYFIRGERAQPFPKIIMAVASLGVAYGLVDIASRFLFPNALKELKFAANYLQFWLMPLILWGLWQAPASNYLSLFLRGLRLAPFVAAMIAMVQFFTGSLERVSGLAGNALPFGDLAVFSAAALWLDDRAWRPGRPRLISMAACVLALICAVLSQARGALLVLPLLMMVVAAFALSRRHLTLRHALLTGIVVVISLGSTIAFTPLGKRFDQMLAAIGQPQNGASIGASENERLIMWRYGLQAMKAHMPWGVGPQNRYDGVSHFAARDGHALPRHNHLHNEYITTMVEKGLMGLFSLVALLIAPMALGFAAARTPHRASFIAFGMVLSLSFAGFGMTNLAFGHDILNSFYVSALCLLAVSVAAERKKLVAEGR